MSYAETKGGAGPTRLKSRQQIELAYSEKRLIETKKNRRHESRIDDDPADRESNEKAEFPTCSADAGVPGCRKVPNLNTRNANSCIFGNATFNPSKFLSTNTLAFLKREPGRKSPYHISAASRMGDSEVPVV